MGKIRVKNPAGQFGYIPEEQRESALSKGYELAPSLAGTATDMVRSGVSFFERTPMDPPIPIGVRDGRMVNLREAGETVDESVQGSLDKLDPEPGGPGDVLRLASSLGGKLTPQDIALNIGGEAFGRMAIGAGIGAAKGATKWGAKKLTSSVLGPSEEAISAALKDPTVLTASVEDLAKDMTRVAAKHDAVIKNMGAESAKKLSTSKFIQPSPGDAGGAFTKDEVLAKIEKARKNLGGIYTDEGRKAAKTLERIKSDLAGKKHSTVSQNEVHDLIQLLDDEIPWDKQARSPQDLSATEKAMIDVRAGLDKSLKERNLAYAEAVKPVAEAINARNEFVQKFALRRQRGGAYFPSDQTANTLKNSLREGKLESERVIQGVKDVTGEDLTPSIRKARFGEEFRGGKTQGSKNVNTGAFVGGGAGYGVGNLLGVPGIGSAAGGAAGALAGSYVDKHGAEIAADLLRKYMGILPKVERAGRAVAPAARLATRTPLMSPFTIGARILAEKNGER